MENSVKHEDLPNIGTTRSELLHETGINTPEELYENGTFHGFYPHQSH